MPVVAKRDHARVDLCVLLQSANADQQATIGLWAPAAGKRPFSQFTTAHDDPSTKNHLAALNISGPARLYPVQETTKPERIGQNSLDHKIGFCEFLTEKILPEFAKRI
jgi:hypothetical protein